MFNKVDIKVVYEGTSLSLWNPAYQNWNLLLDRNLHKDWVNCENDGWLLGMTNTIWISNTYLLFIKVQTAMHITHIISQDWKPLPSVENKLVLFAWLPGRPLTLGAHITNRDSSVDGYNILRNSESSYWSKVVTGSNQH